MKRMLVFMVIGCLLVGSANAQKSAKALYAEIGGPGLASINYDMRFAKKEDGLGFRVGIGGFSVDGTSLFLVPVGLNYIMSKDQKNYFELGAGVTYATINDDFDDGDDFYDGTFGHLNIGYRLQPRDGGFFFRAAINPVFGSGTFFPYYAGIGFGYKF